MGVLQSFGNLPECSQCNIDKGDNSLVVKNISSAALPMSAFWNFRDTHQHSRGDSWTFWSDLSPGNLSHRVLFPTSKREVLFPSLLWVWGWDVRPKSQKSDGKDLKKEKTKNKQKSTHLEEILKIVFVCELRCISEWDNVFIGLIRTLNISCKAIGS